MLWDPIRYRETCPSSDGACAMVIARRGHRPVDARTPAWIHGTAMRSEPTMSAGRDQVNPQAARDCAAAICTQAGITDPREEIDWPRSTCRSPGSSRCGWRTSASPQQGEGWKLTESGGTAMDGRIPVNRSGGVLSSNPIGASGMLRFAEAALQVRGVAGEHQVDGARTALGHAYGGGSQFFSMWVVGAEPPAG